VVVVWLFGLLPTLVVVVHVTVPFSFVKVPPDEVHCCSEGEAARVHHRAEQTWHDFPPEITRFIGESSPTFGAHGIC
jgi:hypothetical protein